MDSKEAIKTLEISNFKSNIGNLYYLDITRFGTETILKDFEIAPKLEYTVLNDSNEEMLLNYNTPIFFADASNPITLKFVNVVATNFKIKNTEKLKFNGSLLEKANISLKSLKNSISFDVSIKNYQNELYKATINLDIPIENNTSNIFSGYIIEEKNNQNIILEKNF